MTPWDVGEPTHYLQREVPILGQNANKIKSPTSNFQKFYCVGSLMQKNTLLKTFKVIKILKSKNPCIQDDVLLWEGSYCNITNNKKKRKRNNGAKFLPLYL